VISSVTVVGASLSGLSTARALRSQGYDGRLIVVGDERHVPYDRPPLSKGFLTGAECEEDLALLGEEDDAPGVDWLLGTPTPYTGLPYFWSEQYGLQVQLAGHRAPGDVVSVVHGSVEERSFVATFERGGRLVAVLGIGATGPFNRWRRQLRRAAAVDVGTLLVG
jgi:NAD/ferredoxin-dependent reductase-like protein/pyridine nucleotide-disulfide oxidoreductase